MAHQEIISAWAEGRPVPTSKFLQPTADGGLHYEPDEYGNTLPDFSHAGFRGGGFLLPADSDVPVRATVSPGEDVQAAIDKVSALPLTVEGYRGTVLLRRGQHSLTTPVVVSASGVVLRGEGAGHDGTLLVGVGPFEKGDTGYEGGVPIGEPAVGGAPPVHTKRALLSGGLIQITGESGVTQAPGAVPVPILDFHVPLGGRNLSLPAGTASQFSVGSKVLVHRTGNEAWWNALELGPRAEGSADNVHAHERTVVAVDCQNDRITIDIGLVIAIEERWGGGEVVACVDEGRIFNVGVENLRGVSEFDPSVATTRFTNMDRPLREAEVIYGPSSAGYTGFEYYSDEDHWHNFIDMDNVRDGWVRGIAAQHFVKSAVVLNSGCKHVTVAHCSAAQWVGMISGSRRFAFQNAGCLNLFHDCQSDQGRHSFVMGGGVGPNVFLDCEATRPYGSSEPHGSLIVGTLYDNVKAPLAFRFARSAGGGRWMGFNSFAWNCEGLFLVQQTNDGENGREPAGTNYSIGHVGLHSMPFNADLINHHFGTGFVESLDVHVDPPSLYKAQLAARQGRPVATTLPMLPHVEVDPLAFARL